ncbi:MAG: DUF3552 domain-containing protein, partial [Gemmatimonadetes bacterium]|nr:DUF3552 domain-containing protein [Gemmatimonadota bacterium]
MSPNVAVLGAALGAVILAGAAFYFFGRRVERRLAEQAARSAEQQSGLLIANARRDAATAKAEAILAGKEEVMRSREDWERDEKGRREEIARVERRLQERETHLDRKITALEEREADLERRDQSLRDKEKHLDAQAQALTEESAAHQRRLEQLAGMSADEAKAQLLREAEERGRSEAAAIMRDLKEEAQKNADHEAKKIVATAIQRIAPEYASEMSVSAVSLPNDEMKGRIIGREGRNIRAFETATGVDVIIDDTPDTVVVSCFDPVRREVARLALEQLITDGRIHPGRIEEIVAKSREQVERQIVEAGEEAAYELGIHGLHPELLKLV